MQNFNVSPFFDDFAAENNFYKALFVPTRPVQTRELNQIQSILQNQIKSHADHIFKNGAMVIPGHVYYDNKVHALKLVTLHNDVAADLIVDNLVGKTLVGTETGVTALVVHYDLSTNTDSPTLYVKFISSSTIDENVKFFKSSEVLYDKDNASTKVKLVSAAAVTQSAIVTVNEGIYYVNGYFLRVARQTITLSKYDNTPTWRAGLEVKESIVSAVEDPSLYDNALGYSNYAAPGADRYKIDLILSKRSFDFDDQETTDENGNVLEEKFIDLIQVKSGNIIKEVNSTEYSEIEKMFARRTFDESGDYEVVPFQIIPKEYRNNVRGAWGVGVGYLEGDYVKSNDVWWEALNNGIAGPTAPSTSIGYKVTDGAVNWVMVNPLFSEMSNNGLHSPEANEPLATQRENSNKIVYQVKPGKAYVQGFEVQTKTDQYLVSTKAQDYEHVEDEIIPSAAGTYVEVQNIRGIPNISSYELVDIYYYNRAEVASFSTDRTSIAASATDDADESGSLNTITVSNYGYGYDRFNPPSITVTGGGGTGASFKAIIAYTGQLQEIRIVDGGSGYSSTATLNFSAPPVTPVKIGTCRIRSIDYKDGTLGSIKATYRLQVFDVNLMPGYEWGIHAKSLISQGAASFAANIVEELVRLPGLVNTTAGSKTITGNGTTFLQDLTAGQYIIIGGVKKTDSTDTSVRVKTDWRTPTSDDSVLACRNLAATATGQTIDAVFSSIYSVSSSLLTPFTKRSVRNVRSADDTTIDTTYTVHRHYDDKTPTAGVITITLTVDGETFAPLITGNYIVSEKTNGTIIESPALSIDPTAKTLTISGLGVQAHEVLVTIEKRSTAGREKTKTRSIKTLDVVHSKTLEKAVLQLNEADVYRIIRIIKADGSGTLTGDNYASWATASVNGFSDITKHFILDNGQTSMFYGLGSLSKKKDCPVLNNTIRIVFEYFNHSAGDFFTVNSYVDVADDKIDPILRDSIDFRPRIADTGTSFLLAEGASITEPTALNTHFKVDYSYYLPKIDAITIDSENYLDVVKGESSFSLKEPAVKSNSMVIGTAKLLPGTYRVDNNTVKIVKKDHKRYTMEDIGKLDRRIGNLEYYTQLSLLEQTALDKTIIDQNGFDRFKSGILVDDFNSQAVSDASHPDFLCSLDFEQGECRSFADVTSVDFKEVALTQTQRNSNHYTNTGGILTLPYTSVTCVEQPLASRTEFVNPFAVVTFAGGISLYPSQDTWFEERRRPTIIEDREGNFNSMRIAAERDGVLGTRWNAWQTNWTGISSVDRQFQNTFNATEGLNIRNQVLGSLQAGTMPASNQFQTTPVFTGSGWGGWTVNTRVGVVSAAGVSTRTGTATSLRESISTTVNDRVLETGIALTIRSRPIIVKAVGMRPNTKVYSFFSGVNVSSYVYDLKELVVQGSITGKFVTYDDGVVDDEDNLARQLNPSEFTASSETDVQLFKGVFFDRGDVIKVFNGSTDTLATAIVVDVIDQTTDNVDEKVIKIVGEKNSPSFDWGNLPSNLSGYNIKSASGNASAAFNQVRSPGIVTNSTGSVYGMFVVPNNTTHKFETGMKLFSFIDDIDNNVNVSTTQAHATYSATGIVQIKQATEINVRNGEFVETETTQSVDATANITIARNVTQLFNTDPLAQTFTISESTGVFITQAEVYFAVKDEFLPVRCEIRSVVNGYPGPRVLALRSLPASEINVSSTSKVPTTFVFPNPVYLMPGVEYCIVLLSDSSVYKVWIARMGETILGTNKLITSQPSLGSLFKSQNNSTWTAEQFDDMTFKLYKAKFDTSRAAVVSLVNKRLPTMSLPQNSMYSLNGSNIVRVNHPNHGFVDGDTVTISGVHIGITGPFNTLGTTYLAGNGVNDKASYIVSNIEYDFYTIEIVDSLGAPVNALYTSQFGGNNIESTYQISYSTFTPNVQIQSFPTTTTTMNVRAMKGDVVNAYNYASENVSLNRENIHYTSSMLIASHDNESKRVAKNKSANITLTLSSKDENLSPVIDSERVSGICVRNKINAPTLENINYSSFDDIVLCTNKSINFLHVASAIDEFASESFFETTDSTLFDDFDKITSGKKITATSGINSGFVFDVIKPTRILIGATPTYRIYVKGSLEFVDGLDASCSLVLHNRYVNELAPYNSSGLSSYISQSMQTTLPSTGVRVVMDVNVPTGTSVEVWHRSMVANSLIPLHEQCWKPIAPLFPIATTADFNSMTEVVFEKVNMSSFDVSQVKIVFISDNPALTPRVSALRMMALA